MKTKVLILLLLNVFNAAKTEFRHHQDRYPKDNSTTYPWFSAIQHKIEEKSVTEITNHNHQGSPTVPEEILKAVALSEPLNKFYGVSKFLEDNRVLPSTQPALQLYENEKKSEKKVYYTKNKRLKKNKFLELETSTSSILFENSNFYFLKPFYKKTKKRNELIITDSQRINLSGETTHNKSDNTNSKNSGFAKSSLLNDDYTGRFSDSNLFRAADHPFLALSDALEPDGCVENVIEDFALSDELVTGDALNDRNGAKNLTAALLNSNDGLNGITDIMESIMEKHPRVASIAITVLNRAQKSKMSQTVYRKENDLFVDRQSSGYPKFLSDKKSSWTPLFWNCLTKTWIFGYSFSAESGDKRIDAAIYFNVKHINGTVDQCKSSFRQILAGGPKCDLTTTECEPLPQMGFMIGGYKCVCLDGFYFPAYLETRDKYFRGLLLEKASSGRNSSEFKCLPCPKSCPGSCTTSGFCIFQRNKLLNKSIFAVQVFSILTVNVLTILVFIHRKCKTIATGMWTIMEVILIGCLFLYGTVIIRTLDPSPPLCLIEPWSRELGFVLCYGAIILKLYRILIEFRTRKAHRWVIRDKDLLKYLLAMLIVMIGYMSAWTAINFYLIRKENYSMLTTGITEEGFHFNTCKSVWWDYVTQISEILILIFGIHLSYASRNATTQFRERCFLCISISVEALISSIFYILRSFYWEATMHPDFNLVTGFIRCHLSTTVVLLLLFIPKWWYQKVQLNKARVSRNYLMQESGRGPLEAFKPQDGVAATNSDVEGEISLADMNPEDIRAELKRLYTQLEVLKNKTIRFDNPHISKRRGGRKMAHRRFSLQALRHQTHRLSAKHMDVEVTEAEASRTPEDSVCSNEGPSIIINDGPSDIVQMTPKKIQI